MPILGSSFKHLRHYFLMPLAKVFKENMGKLNEPKVEELLQKEKPYVNVT